MASVTLTLEECLAILEAVKRIPREKQSSDLRSGIAMIQSAIEGIKQARAMLKKGNVPPAD
jgi:hypothetical protein